MLFPTISSFDTTEAHSFVIVPLPLLDRLIINSNRFLQPGGALHPHLAFRARTADVVPAWSQVRILPRSPVCGLWFVICGLRSAAYGLLLNVACWVVLSFESRPFLLYVHVSFSLSRGCLSTFSLSSRVSLKFLCTVPIICRPARINYGRQTFVDHSV